MIQPILDKVKETEDVPWKATEDAGSSATPEFVAFIEKKGTHINLDDEKLRSSICCPLDIAHYGKWSKILEKDSVDNQREMGYGDCASVFHRKVWGFVFSILAPNERDMLKPRRRGLGFDVGTEPLPALFAGQGCDIVTTDVDPSEGNSKIWKKSLQHADSLESLYSPDRRLRFLLVRMRL